MKYVDPSGEKWWHWLLGEILTGGLVSVTGISIIGTLPSIQSTLSSLDYTSVYFKSWSDPGKAGKQFDNALRIDFGILNSLTGMFRYDKGAKGIEWPMQVINNLSGGEIIQTFFGNSFAHYQNIYGNIDRIGSFQGRTTVRVKSNSFGGYSGVSHGYYVFGENMALNPDDTDYDLELFAHEFGHTYQSRISGPGYYFKYGISSALYADKSEDDADYRAHSNLGVWPHSRQTEPNRTKLWEWLFAPSIWAFMWNWN